MHFVEFFFFFLKKNGGKNPESVGMTGAIEIMISASYA